MKHWPKRVDFCMCWLFQGQPISQAQVGRFTCGQKNQVWTGIYTVILVEGQDMPDCGQGDIYVRLRVGDQRVRSKVRASLSPFIFSLLLLSLFAVLITSSQFGSSLSLFLNLCPVFLSIPH